jgi:RNA polymerase sigma-70 factor (ECF subfamily)
MMQGKHEQPDRPLVVAAQRGEPAAMQALIARDGRWVRGIIAGVVGAGGSIDDIAQEVWIKAWERLNGLRDPGRWRGWLCRLARNTAIDAGRNQSRRRVEAVRLSDESQVVVRQPSPATAVESAETYERVMAAIRGLPVIYREPFMLRHLEDWSYAQIARTLEMPVDTVETRLVRARRLLREALADWGDQA